MLRENALLVVRMTYGPSQGRYMLPGGLLDPGETLDVAAAREVREETGVEARPIGIIGIRTRYDGPNTDNYVLWLLEYVSGDPVRGWPRERRRALHDLRRDQERDDVVYLVKYLAARIRDGKISSASLRR